MKKYLMIGFAAVAFAACSNHDFETLTQEQIIQAEYKANFVQQFGQPASNQTWGFGTAFTRSGNMTGKERVAETSTGINANANEWADKADAPHGHGGWVVPKKLTEKQKAVVAAYFQTVTPLTYTDPQWPNFFVQQVYKGGNSEVRNTTEGITAADNKSAYTSDNMNLLTVGSNPEQHINNFNHGSYGTEDGQGSVGVLDNGYTVNDFADHHHDDQIMLMVNIDDTECMGYHCSATGVSLQRNDKAALVNWETIHTWAQTNYSGYDGCLDDGENRSYVGFDLALKSQEDSYAKGNNGEALYATFTDVPNNNNMVGVWDGTKVIPIGTASTEPSSPDLTSKLATAETWNGTTITEENGVYTFVDANGYSGFHFNINNENWTGYTKMVITFAESTPNLININIKNNGQDVSLAQVAWNAAVTEVEIDLTDKARDNVGQVWMQTGQGTFKFSKIELIGEATTVEYYDTSSLSWRLMDSNMNQYAGESRTITDADLQYTTEDGKICLNLKTINDLLAEGFLPVNGSAMKTWAKWADSDGYYSDWIVTLTEAKRQTTTSVDYQGRIMVEDLSAKADVTGKNSDWDFNDVVFDWAIVDGKAYIKLLAAGGTLPIRIGGTRSDNVSEPANSVEIHSADKGLGGYMVNTGVNVGKTYSEFVLEDHDYSELGAKGILITVQKGGDWVEIQAEQGEPAAKFNCKVGTKWCDEYVNITRVYPDFKTWVANPAVDWTQGDGSTSRLTDGDLSNNE